MGITYYRRKGSSQEQDGAKARPQKSLRRNWLRRLYGIENKASNPIKKSVDITEFSMASDDLVDSSEHLIPQTPSPLLRVNSVIEPAGPEKNKANLADNYHILPSPSGSSIRFSTPSTSEEEVDVFYTCRSSPVKATSLDLSASLNTPTRISRASRKEHRRHPETLAKRMEANYHLRQAFQDHAAASVADGFLTDPVPIRFPNRLSPKMNKTEFESYLEQALSKGPAKRGGVSEKEKTK